MNNEFFKHEKSDTIKWIIAFTLIIALIVGVVAAIFIGLNKPEQKDTPPENDFAAVIHNTEHVKLAMSSTAVLAADNSVSKTLTATVLPETAENKAVDWTVEWDDTENETTVTDYVTVTPTADGSTTATVTCYKPFTGTIIVTATTRENGYSATCVVSFIGIPTDIALNGSLSPVSGEYNVGIGQTYTFDVSLTNPFNQVGEQFSDITCGVSGVGSVVLGYMERYNQSGTEKWYDSSDKTVTLDSLKENFITVSYSGGKLSITTIKSIPNAIEGKDFDFTVGGQTHSYQSETDLTAGFDIAQEENSFTITPKGGINKILAAMYPDGEIEDCRNKTYENMYLLVVTSYNGAASVEIAFSIDEPLYDIILDKGEIVF